MAKDCCAANFERAVFMYRDAVKVAKRFECQKWVRDNYANDAVLRSFGLEEKKPAILLLDGEGGLIHKQQRCVNPPAYVKRMRGAYTLHSKRMKLKGRFESKFQRGQEYLHEQEYGKALRIFDSLLRKRNLLSGSLGPNTDAARTQIEDAAQSLLENASHLREKNDPFAAYKLFRTIKKEFSRLEDVRRIASRAERELASELRSLGVKLR